ncbi:beta/gamma crystallin domain-containing protein 2 isoform X2 [Denticeps clupeoides]|uniref:beta/gamma crystallin domain-containing protein 2 isoform X2 n=1 Tax=Denticeps clupeoides TaxID=299321 RepID=UPI0010A38960|nr:beta/gamma crystallin domain-containing protein 2 isoform X2 [Denticeps clupeoides]
MAKAGIFTKRSLSRSEASVKEAAGRDDDAGRTFPLLEMLKRKKKKKVEEEEGCPETHSEGRNGDAADHHAMSLYGTAPRSKKDLSRSESNLQKPKWFGTFSFSWKKKKRRVDMTQSVMDLQRSGSEFFTKVEAEEDCFEEPIKLALSDPEDVSIRTEETSLMDSMMEIIPPQPNTTPLASTFETTLPTSPSSPSINVANRKYGDGVPDHNVLEVSGSSDIMYSTANPTLSSNEESNMKSSNTFTPSNGHMSVFSKVSPLQHSTTSMSTNAKNPASDLSAAVGKSEPSVLVPNTTFPSNHGRTHTIPSTLPANGSAVTDFNLPFIDDAFPYIEDNNAVRFNDIPVPSPDAPIPEKEPSAVTSQQKFTTRTGTRMDGGQTSCKLQHVGPGGLESVLSVPEEPLPTSITSIPRFENMEPAPTGKDCADSNTIDASPDKDMASSLASMLHFPEPDDKGLVHRSVYIPVLDSETDPSDSLDTSANDAAHVVEPDLSMEGAPARSCRAEGEVKTEMDDRVEVDGLAKDKVPGTKGWEPRHLERDARKIGALEVNRNMEAEAERTFASVQPTNADETAGAQNRIVENVTSYAEAQDTETHEPEHDRQEDDCMLSTVPSGSRGRLMDEDSRLLLQTPNIDHIRGTEKTQTNQGQRRTNPNEVQLSTGHESIMTGPLKEGPGKLLDKKVWGSETLEEPVGGFVNVTQVAVGDFTIKHERHDACSVDVQQAVWQLRPPRDERGDRAAEPALPDRQACALEECERDPPPREEAEERTPATGPLPLSPREISTERNAFSVARRHCPSFVCEEDTCVDEVDTQGDWLARAEPVTGTTEGFPPTSSRVHPGDTFTLAAGTSKAPNRRADVQGHLSSPADNLEELVASDRAMESAYEVSSATFTMRPSPPMENGDDSKKCHKMALAGTGEVREAYYAARGTLTEPSPVSDNRGTSRPERTFVASEGKEFPLGESETSISRASRTSLRSGQQAPPPTYTSHIPPPEKERKAAGPSPLGETLRYPSNASGWPGDGSEVQPSESDGRSRAEPAAPAWEREGGTYSRLDSRTLSDSGTPASSLTDRDQDGFYTGVFKATLVDLTPPSPVTGPVDPLDPSSPSDMETLVDTLKSIEKPSRTRTTRLSHSSIFPLLPPIVEDTPSPSTTEPASSPITSSGPASSPVKSFSEETEKQEPDHHQQMQQPTPAAIDKPTLPPDLGFSRSNHDMRSPLTLMKLHQPQGGDQGRGLTPPLRAPYDSIAMLKSSRISDASPEEPTSPTQVNSVSILSSSRLENSLFFSTYNSQQPQPLENGLNTSHVSRMTLLSDTRTNSNHDPLSTTNGTGPVSRYERLSFLTSPASPLSGIVDTNSHISRPPSLQLSPLSELSFTHKQPRTPTSPPDPFQHTLPLDSSLKFSMGLQRSLSSEGSLGSVGSMGSVGKPLFNDIGNGWGFHASHEPEMNIVPKYRAFPDAYLTKEKEHGKLNPRPGKMLIFDRPGMRGQRIDVRTDVIDATPWDFPETISIRVIRGGWVLYEKPNFKGKKIPLDEGDTELTDPFGLPEDTEHQDGETEDDPRPKKIVIGSVRRAVRDYSVPEICLFSEENAEGKKVVFRDTSEDARIFGFPIKASSLIVNAGLWLVYAQPFFLGDPCVLEVGGFPTPASWGVTDPYVGSVHPLKIGEPRVEKPNEPKLVIYEKAYFTGKSREIYTTMRDFMTRMDRQQSVFMYSVGSVKILGGCWVGYEKEGFRGHQYLLEEGEYHDWRVWGGCNSELRSVRFIRADFSDPMVILHEVPDEEVEGVESNTFEVTEAIPDVEPFGFRTLTRSIHVLSGAWVAYSHVDFSGDQYILEKGFYNNCADWGSVDNRICSIQPILRASTAISIYRNEILLYSEPDFQGSCRVCGHNEGSFSENFKANSCRVLGGSWVLYEGREFSGDMHSLSEGDYPNLTSMGCPLNCTIRSVKTVPVLFAVPSISLFGLECFEGREITLESEVLNMLDEGFNNHILSVRVNSGCWVVCEHSNYRGRQFLLEPIEITNWHKFSELSTIGSLYPIRPKKHFFRIKNKERNHYLSIQGGVEEMKSGRVVVTEGVEGMSDVWYYEDGLIKNKLGPTMSLQVMGNVESGAKVVLWSETRLPTQTWTAELSGRVVSVTYPGMVLDIKGGKSYDRDHVIIHQETEDRPCQQWELELL